VSVADTATARPARATAGRPRPALSRRAGPINPSAPRLATAPVMDLRIASSVPLVEVSTGQR